MRRTALSVGLLGVGLITGGMAGAVPAAAAEFKTRTYRVPDGARPHDVAPDPKGGVVWYAAQGQGALGMLDPKTGKIRQIPLGQSSRPHGVIVGPDGAPWITDSGLNAIVRVDPKTFAVKVWRLPKWTGYANLNTAAFDGKGILWFTGQGGFYGRLDPKTGAMRVFRAPRGYGPYGIAATPAGVIYYASLAGSHIARIDGRTSKATVIEPPTRDQGARRVWSDSKGRIWVSEWNSGNLSLYDPAARTWRKWRLPGSNPSAYAVYVDDRDIVWVSDFGGNALHRFDPKTRSFTTLKMPRRRAKVRQILGRPGEVWLPESGTDRLTVVYTK